MHTSQQEKRSSETEREEPYINKSHECMYLQGAHRKSIRDGNMDRWIQSSRKMCRLNATIEIMWKHERC